MAVSLVYATTFRSLQAFDGEFCGWVKDKEFRNKNGVVVYTPIENGIRYLGTGKGEGRVIQVTALDDAKAQIQFKQGEEILLDKTANYIVVALQARKALTFLIEGIVPENICEEQI